MERYIGLDVHAASCTLGVLSQSGKRVGTHVVETSAKSLTALLDTIPGRKHVCLEEGTMAGGWRFVKGFWRRRRDRRLGALSDGRKARENPPASRWRRVGDP